MTRAIMQQRFATLKETFARCQELDCKITLAMDEKLKTTQVYFIQNYFLRTIFTKLSTTWLDCHKVRKPRPVVHDVSDQ